MTGLQQVDCNDIHKSYEMEAPLSLSPPVLQNWYSCAIMALSKRILSSSVVPGGNFKAKLTKPYKAMQHACPPSPRA